MAVSSSDEQASGAATDVRSRHILLVEDHPVVLIATQSLLEANGYRVTSATSLDEAIACARAYPDLDLLITDYHLAGMGTGKQVVSAVRAMCGRELGAVVISGDTGSAVHQFDSDNRLCWLGKPVNPARLLPLLKHLLQRCSTTQ